MNSPQPAAGFIDRDGDWIWPKGLPPLIDEDRQRDK